MNPEPSPNHAEPAGVGSYVADVADLVERAFHYRGDVTLWTDDGGSVTGYLFNRNSRAAEPFVQLFETRTGREVSIPYRNITGLEFTGRDAAAASARRFEDFQQRQDGSTPPNPDKHPPPAKDHDR